jgi:hypothetical protein
MSFTSFLLKSQLSAITTNHTLGLGPSRDPGPRTPGPDPTVGAACQPQETGGHRRRWRLAGPRRVGDRDGSQRMERCMDCTIRAPRRSSVPSRPARCHQTLAYCSPPFHCVQIYPHAHCKPHPAGRRATIWETSGLVLDVQPSPIRAPRQGGATRSLVATAQARQPAAPGEQAHPPDRRSREPVGPLRAAPGRSILHRVRSWARYLLVPFHQIAAYHSPPSLVSHTLDVSLRPSARAGWTLATWRVARSRVCRGSGSSSGGSGGYRRRPPGRTWPG